MMSKVVVYKVKLYNIVTDEAIISSRMATREGAEIMGGKILEETATEMDASQLVVGEQWTPRGFQCSRGFQTQVNA
ncbi:MAG: hypothetical protein WC689_10940 [Methylocystis sp.]|jgi:hypothetical protein